MNSNALEPLGKEDMLSAETISTFFIASTLLAIAPGPDNVFVLTQSALHGKRSGLIVMTGLCTGLFVHTGAVTLGIAVIFQTSSFAFMLLKIIGAVYLVYLAWQIIRATPEQINVTGGQKKSPGRLYRTGIIMNVTNPKVSLFFLAFLPQFADPQRGAISLQVMALGGVFIAATLLVFGSVALVGGTLGDWLNRSPRTQTVMNRIAGAVFIVLALKLIAVER